MPKMTLHIINARHQLANMDEWLAERLHDAFSVSAKYLPLRDTDVIVKAGKAVIPEKGHLGYAPDKGLIYVTVDPENPILRANPSQSLERMLAHELHHSSRWDGPGYGHTLGEALVSEGLAGRFAQEAYDGESEPWEQVPVSTLRPYFFKAQSDWQSTEYNHADWFFGSQEFPAWVGYSLGYQVVGRYLAENSNARASELVHADALDFRAFLEAV
ncbi:DUF2268 domain-containing putative Zn-dependent protease [Thioclava atlantica]|uniref:DUF2268 domain-containing protein n=1 Tax=Thioclava atlantica TaxID=1317124 RepID=A0A085TZG0_9RHOB|nr:DUF2268 domain-containing putative Zn-dependent protease [Thioclava atlantica]KFE36107.1 hypothetical protein DW2_05740 [Thioclava atlantica]